MIPKRKSICHTRPFNGEGSGKEAELTMRKLKRILVLALAAGLMMSAGACGNSGEETSENADAGNAAGFDINSQKVQDKTRVIESLINNNFYYETDPEKREAAYYKGLMYGLDDKYATYYTPEEFARVREDDEGEYVGIGATVSKNMQTGEIYIVSPIKNSPAEEVGLLPDDVFVEIDGTELTTDMELDEVVKIIRGSEGSTAHLKMYRKGESDFLEFDVPRRKIQSVTVEYEMLENGYGYIKISQFIETTADQFRAAVDELVSKGAKGLIFDVRNNPGGLTDIVDQMVDYLVKDDAVAKDGDPSKPGLILEMRDKNGTILYSDSAKDGHFVDLPMAVLMNGNSASSSEIFIGCLRDYGKVVMVGEKSYGKGIVQQTFPLKDGSAVKMTIAKYFLPAGSNIHETGIEPDQVVELTTEQKQMLYKLPYNEDPQLAAAIKALGGQPLPAPRSTESAGSGTTETTEGKSSESTEGTGSETTETTEDKSTETTEE